MMNEIVFNEFKTRVFDESYSRIFTCLSKLDEQAIWQKPNDVIPAVGNLILHLCGNVRQWIACGIGKELDIRNRNQEFIVQKNIKKKDLIFLLQHIKLKVIETFENNNTLDLNQKVKIQGFQTTYFSAIIHVIEHFSYHTGQITFITKLLKEEETNYYKDFDLNVKT